MGFEAVVSGRLVSVELQSRWKLEDCCLDCCPGSALHTQCGHSKEWGCCGGTGLEIQCSNGESLTCSGPLHTKNDVSIHTNGR